VGTYNILMWISEALLVIIMECVLIFEDLQIIFQFQRFHVEGVHTGQYTKTRPSRLLRMCLVTWQIS
jgi:hypothetical protein